MSFEGSRGSSPGGDQPFNRALIRPLNEDMPRQRTLKKLPGGEASGGCKEMGNKPSRAGAGK